MNILNLTSNQTIKNYKSLCTILDIPMKTGKSKQIQLNDLNRYCTYTKQGQKFVINEILSNPLSKIDHRKDIDKEGNHSKYIENIKALILNKLLQSDDKGYTLTKSNLFEFLGMVNKLYLKKEMAQIIIQKQDDRIKPFDINHFYLRTNSKLTKILFDSLNSLKRKYLIDYREINIIVRTNDKGVEEHKEATKEELLILMSAKYNALTDMGLKSIMQVVLKFKTEEYYSKVNKDLNTHNIKYSYKQIELLYNKKDVQRELSILDINNTKLELNDKIIDTINKNAEHVYNKNIEEYDIKLDEFLYNDHIIGIQKETNFNSFRHKDDYLDIQMELAKYLLKIN